jgi:type IV pilus assembly protein PilM
MNLPFAALWRDPPPAFAFELSEAGVAMARTAKDPEFDFRPLDAGIISVSPSRDNILEPEKLATLVRGMVPPNGGRKRRDAALILPDSSVRVSVLDFDSFPTDAKEQLSLVRFRIKKGVPYDVESAILSYHPQAAGGNGKFDVVVAIAPAEIVARYEAPFRSASIEPGFVTTSALAALELVNEKGTVVVAKLSGRMLTIMVVISPPRPKRCCWRASCVLGRRRGTCLRRSCAFRSNWFAPAWACPAKTTWAF